MTTLRLIAALTAALGMAACASHQDSIVKQPHSVFGNKRFTMRKTANLSRKHAHEWDWQVLGNEDRDADPLRKVME